VRSLRPRESKKLSPEIGLPTIEEEPIPNEEVKKRTREILEEMEQNRKQEKKVEKKDKPGGKSP
jgi:hypothetical protein